MSAALGETRETETDRPEITLHRGQRITEDRDYSTQGITEVALHRVTKDNKGQRLLYTEDDRGYPTQGIAEITLQGG